MENRELMDKELDQVVGGMITQKVIEKINTLYPFVPEELRDRVTTALTRYGNKAAKALALRLTEKYPPMKHIANLISGF